MSVGVLKTKIAALNNASSNYTVKSEQDVYVLNTSDESIELLTTADSIGGTITLTGSQSISTDSGATATIGSNTVSNSTSILSRTVNIGDSSGNTSIHIGNQNETNSSVISIGSTLANVTIGQPDSVNGISGSTKLENKVIQIGKVLSTYSPSNSGSIVAIDSDSLSTVSKGSHTSRAVGTLKLVGGNNTLTDSSTRSELVLGDELDLVSKNGGLRMGGITTSSGDCTVASSSSGLVKLQGSTAKISSTGNTTIEASSVYTDSPTVSIRNSINIDNFNTLAYMLNASNNLASTGVDHQNYYGELDLYCKGVDYNTLSQSVDSSNKTASLLITGDLSTQNSFVARSKNGLLLRGDDKQLQGDSGDTSGAYVSLSSGGSYIRHEGYDETNGTYTISNIVASSSGAVIATSHNTANHGATGTTWGSGGLASINPDIGSRFYSSNGFYAQTGGYSPFTGVHIFDIMPNEAIQVGDAVELVNKQARVSSSPTSKICVGIAISIRDNKVEVAAVGDTECGELKGFKVCDENGSITAGDLLVTSSRPGYLMKQTDDIQRSTTVGKSAVDVEFNQDGLAVDIYGFVYCG